MCDRFTYPSNTHRQTDKLFIQIICIYFVICIQVIFVKIICIHFVLHVYNLYSFKLLNLLFLIYIFEVSKILIISHTYIKMSYIQFIIYLNTHVIKLNTSQLKIFKNIYSNFLY